ncbi:MAG: hypothetical protein VYA84_17135 [Planctomycetota bacterium]|nr:hypothetical protein [Planctomycetota bacterium]
MSPSIPTLSIQSLDGRFRIDFRWEQDRYRQYLCLNDVLVGSSLEGDSDEAWPPSPPIQQLSIETINDQPTALAVGAAGRGHWSLSGEPDPNCHSAIQFELACRSQEATQFLGSTYELAASLHVEPIDGEVDLVDRQSNDDPAARQQITIRPISIDTTCRWRYRIEPT